MANKRKKIELYVNSEKGKVKGSGRENLPPLALGTTLSGGAVGRNYDSWQVKKAFVGLTSKEKELIYKLEHIATQYNIDFCVHDIAKTRNPFRTFFKGVKETPTIVIGRFKFKEDYNEKDLLKALEI